MSKLYHIKQNKTIRILQKISNTILLKCDKNQQNRKFVRKCIDILKQTFYNINKRSQEGGRFKMTDNERKQKLIENILNKFDKLNSIRQEKEKQDFNPVPLSR